MKVIIAGSRQIRDERLVHSLITNAIKDAEITVTEIVSGTARGVDQFGESWAKKHSIPIKKFPADWKKFGRTAGFVRNSEMSQYADALIAIWDGKSAGTRNMFEIARRRNLVTEIRVVHI